ncbi:type II secretion system F family protein, partial [Candidatus Woesearchaeota archaeon]|nr:type II secretion system F family protein [Candidatus Woesearchaeota archaeon]
METLRNIFLHTSAILPKKYKKTINELLVYSGEKKFRSEEVLGATTLISFLIFISVLILSLMIKDKVTFTYLIFGLLGVFLAHFFVYMFLYFKAEERTNKIEKALPDAFQLIAANIRSGMTPFQALKYAARDEFGPLKEEIEYITTRALGTADFSGILLQISKRVKSELLDRSFKLFASAMHAGGRLADLLDDMARDITETRSLKNELTTSTKTYIMFILFTVLVGMPLLLSLAINFLEIMSSLQTQTGAEGDFGGVASIAGGQIAITPDYMFKIAIIMIVLTSIFASILMGVIKEGN